MSSTDTRSESDRFMASIEREHFNGCLWQSFVGNRSIMVECFHYPKGGTLALVVKHYEKPIPRVGSGKPWPKMIACSVYLPIDDSNTWDGLEKTMANVEVKHVAGGRKTAALAALNRA